MSSVCVSEVALQLFWTHVNAKSYLKPLRDAQISNIGAGMARILRRYGAPSLASLDLRGARFVTDDVAVDLAASLALPALTRLDLSVSGVGDRGLAALAEHCPSLASVSLYMNDRVKEKGLVALAKHRAETLQCLDLRGANALTPGGVSALGSCRRLEELLLKNVNCGGGAVVAMVQGTAATSLVHLDLTGGCRRIGPEGSSESGDDDDTTTVSDAANLAGLNDSHLLAILARCTALGVLMLTECHMLTDESVAAIGTHTTALRELSVYQCAMVTDRAIVAIATGCNRTLERINFRSCPYVTDESLRALEACRRLSGICCENTRVTDEGVRSLLEAIGEDLEFMPSNCCIIPDLWPGNSTCYYDGATDGAVGLFGE